LAAEDDPEDTIRPRLDAAEADCGRIVALTMVTERDAKTGETRRRGFSLVDDIAVLEAAIKQHPECRLVIIDPVSAYLGAVDSHKNAEIRGVLAPLAELAQRAKVAVLAVTHLNKGSGRAIYRAMGSIAFVAAARSTFIVVKDDDDPQRRLMVTLKNNLAADQIGFAYRVETAPNGAPVVMWEPESFTVDLDDLLGDGPGDQATKRDNAGEWLSALLINGPVLRDEIYERAEKAGIKDHTLRRAKQANKAIKAKRKGFGGRWYWGFEDDFPGKDKPVPTVTEDGHLWREEMPKPSNDAGSTIDAHLPAQDGHLCGNQSATIDAQPAPKTPIDAQRGHLRRKPTTKLLSADSDSIDAHPTARGNKWPSAEDWPEPVLAALNIVERQTGVKFSAERLRYFLSADDLKDAELMQVDWLVRYLSGVADQVAP
jgi:hypothetical protein